MASKKGGGRSGKSDIERKKSKVLDDSSSIAVSQVVNDTADVENSETGEANDSQTPLIQDPANNEMKLTEDDLPNEPTLTEIIVESYEGGRNQGLFEGFGECSFISGNLYSGNFFEGKMHGLGKYLWHDFWRHL